MPMSCGMFNHLNSFYAGKRNYFINDYASFLIKVFRLSFSFSLSPLLYQETLLLSLLKDDEENMRARLCVTSRLASTSSASKFY